MMEPLSPQNERLLTSAVKQAQALIDDGKDPTSAVTAVAKTASLNPHFIDLVCYALNTGGVRSQQEEAAGVLDKMAEFPLADAEAVKRVLYPSHSSQVAEKAASAVDPVYSKPVLVKKASESREWSKKITVEAQATSQKTPQFDKLAAAVRDSRQALRQAKFERSQTHEKLANSMRNVQAYFRKFAYDRLPWAEVRNNACLTFGKIGETVLNWVDSELGITKKAQARDRLCLYGVMDVTQEPYASLAACRELTEKLAAADQVMTKAAETLAQAENDYRTWLQGPQPEPERDVLGNVKRASALEFAMGSALGQKLNDVVSPSKPTGPMVHDKTEELSNPGIEADLRKARVQAMMTDYMANDEVLSGYDPDEVMNAYNELSQIMPRAADNPGIMRSALRQRMAQGSLAPFDVEQMTGIDKSLGQSRRSSGVLGNDNVLG